MRRELTTVGRGSISSMSNIRNTTAVNSWISISAYHLEQERGRDSTDIQEATPTEWDRKSHPQNETGSHTHKMRRKPHPQNEKEATPTERDRKPHPQNENYTCQDIGTSHPQRQQSHWEIGSFPCHTPATCPTGQVIQTLFSSVTNASTRREYSMVPYCVKT